MTGLSIAQLVSAVLAACTPYIVAEVALRVATSQPGAAAAALHSMKRLRAMTITAAAVAAIATATLGSSPWRAVVVLAAFGVTATIALRVLGEIDELTRSARLVSAAERSASLTPRKPGEYLPWSWRLAVAGTAVFGAAAFVFRASSVAGERRMFVPVMFAAAAVIFLWLYEVWAHQVITGPIVAGDEGNVRRVVRRIFAMELLLVVTCIGTAHALLDLSWSANSALGAAISIAAGGVATVGCALALASGLMGRRYEAAGRYDGREGATRS